MWGCSSVVPPGGVVFVMLMAEVEVGRSSVFEKPMASASDGYRDDELQPIAQDRSMNR